MIQIKAVIFDWAGTTIDFGCMAPVQALVDSFAEFGMQISPVETREPMGMATRDHLAAMLAMPRIGELFEQQHGRSYSSEDIDAIYAVFEEKMLASIPAFTCPKPYVVETLESLKEEGFKTGSTTHCSRKLMEAAAPAAAVNGYAPDYWACPDDVDGYGRPYPYMLFLNMQKLGIQDVNSVIKVGDTEADIAEGIAAGVWTVGVLEGSAQMGLSEAEYQALSETEKIEANETAAEAFWSYGADFVIQDMSEIFEVIRLIETDLEEDDELD